MIITCPSCATRHNIASSGAPVDGSLVRCANCGHSWLEGSAVEVTDIAVVDSNASPPVLAERPVFSGPGTQDEVARIAKAAREAEEQRLKERAQRIRTRNGWLVLASVVALPLITAISFPDAIARAVPATARLYKMAGLETNLHGLELAQVNHQHVLVDNIPVLAVRGTIVNVTDKPRKVPPLRFILTDGNNKPVYSWTLSRVLRQKLGSGNSASFVTRITSPPKSAQNLQIRFATEAETGHTD